jgi:hypothetical protein
LCGGALESAASRDVSRNLSADLAPGIQQAGVATGRSSELSSPRSASRLLRFIEYGEVIDDVD